MQRVYNNRRIVEFIEREQVDVTVGLGYVRENDLRVIMERADGTQVYFTGNGYAVPTNGIKLISNTGDKSCDKVENIKEYCASDNHCDIVDIVSDFNMYVVYSSDSDYAIANELNEKVVKRVGKIADAYQSYGFSENDIDKLSVVCGDITSEYLFTRDIAELNDLIDMGMDDFVALIKERVAEQEDIPEC